MAQLNVAALDKGWAIATDMAKNAGMGEIAEPVELVARSIVVALESDEFHAFPDSMAKHIGAMYHDFASHVVDANLMEG
jgi:hypothetical protein